MLAPPSIRNALLIPKQKKLRGKYQPPYFCYTSRDILLKPCTKVTLGCILLSGCNIQITEAISTNNKMSFCHSEAVAYTNYVSTLFDDLDTGIISQDDMRGVWERYTGDGEPSGTGEWWMYSFSYRYFCSSPRASMTLNGFRRRCHDRAVSQVLGNYGKLDNIY